MKKIYTPFLLCLLMILPALMPAQAFNFTTTQQSNCWDFNNNTINAAVTSTAPGANNYSFVAIASGTNCQPTYTNMTPNGSSVTIIFPCCGVYTITCIPFANLVPVGVPIVKTATLGCPNGTGPFGVISNPASNTICAGFSLTLSTPTPVGTYTWSNGATGSSIVITPTASTCYSVTRSYSCRIDTASKCITVNLCTGLGKTGSGNEYVSVFPNPAKEMVVMTSQEGLFTRYSLLDITGRELIHGSFRGSHTLDVSQLSRGIYILKFDSGSKTQIRKIVVDN